MSVPLPDPVMPAPRGSSEDIDLTGPLVDGHGRIHRDLRISLTDRCSLRCTYCMPAEGVPWLTSSTLLTTSELVRIARVAVEQGVSEIRLTGGEPLLRPDIVDVVAQLVTLQGPAGTPEVSLTTNALRLASLAAPLHDAGLTRVNISLDTLDRQRFLDLTRRDRLHDALAGIEAARSVGFTPIKLNAVAMRGVNEDELVAMTQFAVDRGLQMRFIEHMPLDAGHTWDRTEMVTADEILDAIGSAMQLTPLDQRGSSPAQTYRIGDGPATLGVIASVTRPFCGACDRIRLTADGQLRACLFAREESDLRTLLRSGADNNALARALRINLASKQPGHGIDDPSFLQPDRPMSAIGG